MSKITIEEVREFLLKTEFQFEPGQGKVSFPLLQRIHARLQRGIKLNPIQISSNRIVDGHHRYICLSMLEIVPETSMGGSNITTNKFEWSTLEVEPTDYDTDADINRYRDLYDTK